MACQLEWLAWLKSKNPYTKDCSNLLAYAEEFSSTKGFTMKKTITTPVTKVEKPSKVRGIDTAPVKVSLVTLVDYVKDMVIQRDARGDANKKYIAKKIIVLDAIRNNKELGQKLLKSFPSDSAEYKMIAKMLEPKKDTKRFPHIVGGAEDEYKVKVGAMNASDILAMKTTLEHELKIVNELLKAKGVKKAA